MIRFLFRLWHWLRAPRRHYMSNKWLRDYDVREYDDNPRAKGARWE
jgi:hypothetical protein